MSDILKKRQEEMDHILKRACSSNLGGLDLSALCSSIGTLDISDPIMVRPDSPLSDSMQLLRENKVGCVLITGSDGKLEGIFTERDYVLKAYGNCSKDSTVQEYMTVEPVTETPDCTIAFALNLMSQGGFRHLPVVDQDGCPIGALSVKDMVDHIVTVYLKDVMDVELEE